MSDDQSGLRPYKERRKKPLRAIKASREQPLRPTADVATAGAADHTAGDGDAESHLTDFDAVVERAFAGGYRGVPPEATSPPMWTVPMACIWAATRDHKAVERVELDKPDDERWLLVDGKLPFHAGAHVMAWHSHLFTQAALEPLPRLGVALRQLQDLAARGEVIVRGILRDQGNTIAIPADAWGNLQIESSRSARGLVAAPPGYHPSGSWWSRLRVLPGDMLKIWPQQPLADSTSGAVGSKAEPPPKPPLRKIGDKEVSQTARCQADLRLVFPDGDAPGSYHSIADRVEKQTGRRYSKDVYRVALGRKKP
jgi:hypothetical protein